MDFRGLRRSVLAFLRPDPLTRSLANRIFGRPSADQFNWVGQHREELALLGVECPQWLPFLKYASRGRHLHPLRQLQRDLEQAGITPGGWASLPDRGIAAMDDAVDFAWICNAHEVIAAYANLLEQMEVSGQPHRVFTALVVSAAAKGMADFDPAVLEGRPTWFWRALWVEFEARATDDDCETLVAELARA